MADANWIVKTASTFGGTYTTIDDVQAISMNVGRAKITDQWRPSTITISGFDASNVTGIEINHYLQVYADTSTQVYWFRVSDVVVNYDFVANGDTWEIVGEGALAAVGRSVADQSLAKGSKTLDAAAQLLTDAPVTVVNDPGKSTIEKVDVLDTNPIPAFQTLLTTEQGYVNDYNWGIVADKLILYERGAFNGTPTLTMTDDGTGSTTELIKYEAITFASRGEDYVTGVLVDPHVHGIQTSGTIERAYVINSYDETAAQALDLAAFIKTSLNQAIAFPASITTNVKTWADLDPLLSIAPGQQMYVRLRGTQYNCQQEGFSINATPAQTRIAVRVSPATAYNNFTLDDAILGQLDNTFALLGF